MKQYWIRLTFSDPNRRTDHRPLAYVGEAPTLEAARLGRPVDRVNLYEDDTEACAAAKRWLRLSRNAAGDAPKFDRWAVITEHPRTRLPYAVASGEADE
jgi:hypothetical protein